LACKDRLNGSGAQAIASSGSTKNVYPVSELMSTKIVDTITPAQSRAARALLEITQSELADAANLGLSTVVDFEKKRRQVSALAIQAIRDALAASGVEFIDENGGGPGVRLRKRQRKKD
jgi:DNA-binding transcriptional regulator YiaG